MCEVLRQTVRKARKEHYCTGAGLIRKRINEEDIEAEDAQILAKCARKIKAGEQYLEVASVDMGSVDSWRSHKECADLCHKYEAWDEC